MESIDPVWLYGAMALACGVFIGILINRLLNPSAGDVDQLKADLQQERAEMERYKASVNSHFNKTSELVNDLTQDYVKVYRHLAEGAQTLSDTREFTQVLEQPRGRVLISVEDESGAAAAGSKSVQPQEAEQAATGDGPTAPASANTGTASSTALKDEPAPDAGAAHEDDGKQRLADDDVTHEADAEASGKRAVADGDEFGEKDGDRSVSATSDDAADADKGDGEADEKAAKTDEAAADAPKKA